MISALSREGAIRLHELHPDVPIYAASVDNTLRRDGYIAPGLGDAGDRLYSTPDKQRSVYDSASAGLAASGPRAGRAVAHPATGSATPVGSPPPSVTLHSARIPGGSFTTPSL